MVQLPSFLRPTTTPAPVAGAWPGAPVAPAAAPARPFTIDLFTPSAVAPAQLPMSAFRAPTIDDLEAMGGSHFLDVGADDEPVGGAAARTLREGASGADVERLQSLLAARGFDPGGADGDFGPATERALRAFQRSQGLEADGQYGPATRARLTGHGGVPAPRPAAPEAPGAPVSENGGTRARLMRGVNNGYNNRSGKCFKYAWRMVSQAGLDGIGAARQSYAGRNAGTAHVGDLVRQGKIRVGDVIYVNRVPGADPSSTNMRYGPHWFVYVGNGQFADQYGIRGAQAMSDFVPGRKIDTIYHTA